MDTLLRVVGGLALVLFGLLTVVLIAIVLFIRYSVRKMKGLARAMGGPVAPVAIELAVLDGDVPLEVERLAAELERHGFVRSGAYGAVGVPDYEVIGMANEAEDVYAAVAIHPMLGPHVDLVQSAPDGRTLAVTNSKEMSSPAPVPGRTVVRRTDASVDEILNEWRIARLTGAVDPTPRDGFVREFERQYRLVMEFQYREGRFKEIDVDSISGLVGMRPDPRTAEFLETVRQERKDSDPTL